MATNRYGAQSTSPVAPAPPEGLTAGGDQLGELLGPLRSPSGRGRDGHPRRHHCTPVTVPVRGGCLVRGLQVGGYLEERHKRVPTYRRQYVAAAPLFQPVRAVEQQVRRPPDDRVGGVLQIDDP